MTFADIARRTAKLAIDNSPTILTSIGVAGFVTTTYLAGKASFQAADIIRLKEADAEARAAWDELPTDPKELLKQRVQLVWKLYIPAGVTFAGTLACLVGANRIGARRAAGLAAAYTIAEKASEEYKAKVVEKIGEKKEELIRSEIIQDRINANWDDDSIEIHGKPEGEVFYDKFSDRYVWNTREGLRETLNDLNQAIIHNGYATVGDFYHLLEMPAPSWSHEIGWNSDRLPRIQFTAALTPGGKPVVAFEFDALPVHNYQRFH